jgi:hypothetical protein
MKANLNLDSIPQNLHSFDCLDMYHYLLTCFYNPEAQVLQGSRGFTSIQDKLSMFTCIP